MTDALYGPAGFFVRGAPADHFRTSAHASPLFAAALARVAEAVDRALAAPDRFDLVDVGAGRGELLAALLARLPEDLRRRVRPVAVELAPRPAGLPPGIAWRDAVPEGLTGLLLATEWLDNVPLDLARGGHYRTVADGDGGPLSAADARWCARWWPAPAGPVEIGLPRDRAWAAAVAAVDRGAALAVDYGHTLADRPPGGTLTGYRRGRQVPAVPDGSCDLTAHVAVDAVAEAGGRPYHLVSQRTALRALGLDAARPPLALAHRDPAAYLARLAAAGEAAELLAPAGLGAHHVLLHPRGLPAGALEALLGTPEIA